jgi:hypothetical protein
MITDYDVGVGQRTAFIRHASLEPVLRVFHRNVEALKSLLAATVPRLGQDYDCGCDRPLAAEYYKNRRVHGPAVTGAP